MTALGHSFRTEIESKSFGNPTFLSRHLDALCPPTQEEDDWLEQELERARQQRGSFYRKLASSRATSVRDLDELNGSRQFSASRASTERDLSVSPTGSTTSPPPAIPEPHSSWRFYTSYDNGEWKRHCVPDKKTEEDVLIKSPTSEKDKEASPAYESHLRKYRQARASLFDRPARKFTSSISPQGETTTVRVVSHGKPGGLRSALGGSTNRLPFGGSTPDIRFKTIREPEMSNATSLPSHYREETTTSETITSVSGAEMESPKPKGQQPQQPAAVRVLSKPPRHNNLGFKEKIIIPTKYKSGSAAASKENNPSSVNASYGCKMEQVEKKTTNGIRKQDEPSFLGSTFEKFSYDGKPLVKPTFPDENSGSKRKPFGDPFSPNSNDQAAKRRPVFGSPSFTTTEIKVVTGSGDIPHSNWGSDYLSSTPVNMDVKYASSTERRSLPFGSPVERSIPVRNVPALEKPIPQFEKSRSVIQPPEENNVTLGTENSAFSVPNKNKPLASANSAESMNGERVIYSRVHGNAAKSTDPPKSDGVVFIPVIRVNAPSQDGFLNHQEGNDVNDHGNGKLTDGLTGFPILELLEDSGGGDERVNGFTDNRTQDLEQRLSPGSHSNASGSEQIDLNNNRRVRNAPLRDITNRNGSHENENQDENDGNERVLYPSSSRNKPVFPSSGGSTQRVKPFGTSSLQNLSSKSEERTFKSEDRLPTGERIIIPSKYRQKTTDNSISGSNGFLSENKSQSTFDVSTSASMRDRASSSDGSSYFQRPVGSTFQGTKIERPNVLFEMDTRKGSFSSSSDRIKHEKPVFRDIGWGGSAEALPRMPKSFERAEGESKQGNDSGVSVNPDNSHTDGVQPNHESFSSPDSIRNDSREGDSGIWRDPGIHSLRKDTSGGNGWVIERADRF